MVISYFFICSSCGPFHFQDGVRLGDDSNLLLMRTLLYYRLRAGSAGSHERWPQHPRSRILGEGLFFGNSVAPQKTQYTNHLQLSDDK